MNGMGFGWGRGVECKMPCCMTYRRSSAAIFFSISETKLYQETVRPDQTGTCAAQGNPKRTAGFRSSPRGLPLVAAAAHFLNRPGRTAGLPLDNLVSASHFSVRLVLLFSYFQSIVLTLHSCKKTMPCRAVLCYAMLGER